MRITLMGHMTVRIELDGMVLLTDPWFGPHRWLEERLAPRTVPPAAVPDELVPLDAMLVSHNHLDHLDGAALDLARCQGCTVIGSQHAAHRARKAGVEQAIALRRSEQARLGPLTIQGVYAVDRAAGLRIDMNSGRQVESAVQRWAAGLDAEGLRVKMLGRGESWDVEA